jgi:DNA-binding transcriptional LysR family regulator
MDWNDLKIALAVARHGSHSAAARALGMTQPTGSRRLAGLERKAGVKLFERGKDGLTPTQLGAALTDGLDLMDEGARWRSSAALPRATPVCRDPSP